MRTTLISDLHLAEPDQAHALDLLRLLATWPTEAWVLLGDVFDDWWGWEHSVYVHAVPVLAALHAQIRAGRTVVWVPGNRDPRPGGAAQRLGIEVRSAWRAEAGGAQILAVHGDVEAGIGQRLLDRAIRGRPTRALARALGPERVWPVLRRAGDLSRRANHGPDPSLIARQARYVDRRLAEGLDIVCLGHSHAPGVQARPGGTLVNLGDWVGHRSFAVVDREVRLIRWRDGEVVEIDGPPRSRRGCGGG
ncbi:MAG: hypothetical protein EA397_05945 [Deltaproteobacteria bacterium]|nr:MAG: hypothetical protein EA397_05945 [Deltaproteobacteria bacterium]